MTEKTNPRVIVALPAYNEDRFIGSLVLKARKYAAKIIVADDGSTDNTAEIARLAGASVITHPANQGKGAAIQSIISEVKKDLPEVLILLDADGQHNPDEIPRFIEAVLSGSDLVIGSRKLARKSIPSYRRVGQKVLLFSNRFLTSKKITDSESGFRAFSRKAIAEMELNQQGFAVESEMIAVAEEKKLKITEVPISVQYQGNSSTLNPVRHGVGVLTQILNMISERKPLFFFGTLGGILSLGGLLAGIRAVQIFSEHNVLPIGTVMLSVLFFIIGVLCLFTGVILHALTRRK
jgi:glycosyltransferase involved in cell wall biosynthesis